MPLTPVPLIIKLTYMNSHAIERVGWFERLMGSFFSYTDDGHTVSDPEKMINEAAQRAFKISTALGLIPGPVAIVTILPEIVALTKLQMNLIRRIARYHRKQEKVTRELILLIFGNVVGIAAGEAVIKRVGTRLIIRSVHTTVMRGLAKKIGSRIIDRAAQRAVARWLPMIVAPLFGYFSRTMTEKIGREADRIFSGEIEIEAIAQRGECR